MSAENKAWPIIRVGSILIVLSDSFECIQIQLTLVLFKTWQPKFSLILIIFTDYFELLFILSANDIFHSSFYEFFSQLIA